jgi:parallel beta-helix repeat protein
VRGWDCGGFKIGDSKQGVFRRCVFRRNQAQGLWLDRHVRNVLITECVFERNRDSGLFIEISRDIYVLRNLFIGNGNAPGTDHNWGDAGIKLGESMNCVVA